MLGSRIQDQGRLCLLDMVGISAHLPIKDVCGTKGACTQQGQGMDYYNYHYSARWTVKCEAGSPHQPAQEGDKGTFVA